MVAKIEVQLPRKRAGQDRGTALRELDAAGASWVALIVAREVRERVKDRGQTVQKAPSYDADGPRFVASRYPVVSSSGYQAAETGVVVYRNSKAMHENVRPGSYNVSGGMWAGLAVVVGYRKASIRFRGRSIGQDTPRTAKGKRVYRGRKVSNALKAATVREAHKVNILAMTDGELKQLYKGALAAVDTITQRQMNATPVVTERGLDVFGREVRDVLEGRVRAPRL